LAKSDPAELAKGLESKLIQGDLAKLTPEQRTQYYMKVCQSLGLNPLTQPFAYITLNGRLKLYALRECTEQLRRLRGVSVTGLQHSEANGLYVVTANAKGGDGRTDASTGAVTIDGLKGDARANAVMKAETKAKRRVTLSICGLGMLDESEAHDISGAAVEAAVLPADGDDQEKETEVTYDTSDAQDEPGGAPESDELADECRTYDSFLLRIQTAMQQQGIPKENLKMLGKAMRDAFNPAGREVLTAAQYETVCDMATAVRQHATAARIVRELTHREHAVFWTDAATSMRCKGRLDGVGPGYILSLKTAREDTPEAFGRTYFQRLYHGQAAFYADGHGGSLPEVTVVVQNHEPYDVWVLDTPPEAIDEGRRVYGELLEKLKTCDGDRVVGAVPDRAVLPVPRYIKLDESTDVFGSDS